jgi:hypothetical protein
MKVQNHRYKKSPLQKMFIDLNQPHSAGFEPARGDPNRFQVCRLNHSATNAERKVEQTTQEKLGEEGRHVFLSEVSRSSVGLFQTRYAYYYNQRWAEEYAIHMVSCVLSTIACSDPQAHPHADHSMQQPYVYGLYKTCIHMGWC